MKRDLSGDVAIVTGGARGIGRGIACELAKAGAVVAVADLDLNDGRLTAEAIRAGGGRAIAVQVDVSDDQSVVRCVGEILGDLSHVEILVNGAGVFQREPGLQESDQDFMRCVDVNLAGVWRMVRAVVPHFRSHCSGRIVNISSVFGRRGVDFAAGYCAAKAGVISLTQSLALALGDDNINVNAICPGAVATDMQEEIRRLRHASGLEANREEWPIAGPVSVEDIGQAAVFLVSRYARNITGQALNVDGGQMLN